jgi:hypothetical protein
MINFKALDVDLMNMIIYSKLEIRNPIVFFTNDNKKSG